MSTKTVTLRNVNPLGTIELPLLGRVLEAGEEFEVPAVKAGHAPSAECDTCGTADYDVCAGDGLLGQVGNYELVEAAPAPVPAPKPRPARPRRPAAPKPDPEPVLEQPQG